LEDSDEAIDFTLMIANLAIRDTVQLTQKCGFTGKVSINVPPKVLLSESFTDRLCAMLKDHGLAAERFQCEITERGLESPGPQASATMARLRMKGIQLSIDDFGVGQSGLSKIKTRAFDEIKIDRSFISDLTSSLDSRSIVESIIHLASLVGMRVVAEGIEDNPTLLLTKRLGVANVQGYYCARPMPKDEFCSWLGNWPGCKQPVNTAEF
jgi:EAL domain-containing protein (putative c-di-GMP-specific phosphodiesterase class I)